MEFEAATMHLGWRATVKFQLAEYLLSHKIQEPVLVTRLPLP